VRVLVANAGSSSLKLSVIADGEETLAETQLGQPSEAGVMQALLAFAAKQEHLDAVGHRIVHGGPDLQSAVLVDERVRAQLNVAAEIAPLHVLPALHVLDALREHTDVPQIACFDTSFHAALPAPASTYAIPPAWRERYGIRRYGFHGLSCAWSLQRASRLLARPANELQLLVAHLGAGASVSAIRHGHSIDTSMGFTPLEGLVMSTRSGTVDPGAILWLQTAHGLTASEVTQQLEHASGTLGLGGSADMREVLERAATGDASAALARDVYVHRARALFASMAASLERIDAIVFTGGVGENAAEIRDLICRGLYVLGVARPTRTAAPGADAVISAASAAVAILVTHAREDLEINREVRELISVA
jgi:acetate kinase